jgi:hypothetical protein
VNRPTRFEDEGGHQTPFTSGADATGGELRTARPGATGSRAR